MRAILIKSVYAQPLRSGANKHQRAKKEAYKYKNARLRMRVQRHGNGGRADGGGVQDRHFNKAPGSHQRTGT